MAHSDYIRLDMHVHTRYSRDSNIDPRKIGSILESKEMDGAAIVDHDSLEGFRECRRHTRRLIVPGVEIHTSLGEILALFVKQEIAVSEFPVVVDSIREQDAIIVLPHPFDWLRRHSFKLRELDEREVAEVFDCVEALNSRCVFSNFNRSAEFFARKLGKPMIAGSDAHFSFEVGRAHIICKMVSDIEDVRIEILKQAVTPAGRISSPFVHALTLGLKLARKGLIDS